MFLQQQRRTDSGPSAPPQGATSTRGASLGTGAGGQETGPLGVEGVGGGPSLSVAEQHQLQCARQLGTVHALETLLLRRPIAPDVSIPTPLGVSASAPCGSTLSRGDHPSQGLLLWLELVLAASSGKGPRGLASDGAPWLGAVLAVCQVPSDAAPRTPEEATVWPAVAHAVTEHLRALASLLHSQLAQLQRYAGLGAAPWSTHKGQLLH